VSVPTVRVSDMTRYKGAHHRIDQILDELMITEETDFVTRLQLYMKLLREATPMMTQDDLDKGLDALKQMKEESVNAMNGKPNKVLELSVNFEAELRRCIEKHEEKDRQQ
jgi:hypothetical protein